jgi:hypothetical protein
MTTANAPRRGHPDSILTEHAACHPVERAFGSEGEPARSWAGRGPPHPLAEADSTLVATGRQE